MCCLAVITLIIVVRQSFPVIVAAHPPGVVELEIFEVERSESSLSIDTFELVGPCDLWRLLSVQIDPDESVMIDVNMNGEKVVLYRFEVR